MADLEQELDATLERAKATLAETEKTMAAATRAREEFAVWREENGVTPETAEKFTAALSEEDKKKVAAEQEEWERQLQHDLDAAAAKARPAPTHRKRPRSYI